MSTRFNSNRNRNSNSNRNRNSNPVSVLKNHFHHCPAIPICKIRKPL
jgi:hypothetical protein